MGAAVTAAAKGVMMEWERRFFDQMKVGWTESRNSGVSKKAKKTLLARYEHACTLGRLRRHLGPGGGNRASTIKHWMS